MKDILNFVYQNKMANIFMIQNMTTSLAPDRLVREREEERKRERFLIEITCIELIDKRFVLRV